MTDINERLRRVQSWWLGSELVRRHPELLLIETHPGGGQYDCLTLLRVGPDGEGRNLVDLNRAGSIHVAASGSFMTWERERDFGDRHGAVKLIEAEAGLPAPTGTPSSTGKVLTYRALASIMTSMLNERAAWDARNLLFDSSVAELGPAFDIAGFPSAAEAVREVRREDLDGRPEYRFWGLMRGQEVLAVLDVDGTVHLQSGPRSLPSAYVKNGRRLHATIASTLRDVLP